eukprot:m.17768 g.17768  ORF g.17768 m.17768 type:complete len:393 (+) comp6106_c0_seq1:111-1289(+)
MDTKSRIWIVGTVIIVLFCISRLTISRNIWKNTSRELIFPQNDWDRVAQSLGSSMSAYIPMLYNNFHDFDEYVIQRAELHAVRNSSFVLYPCSGGDVFTPLAVHPFAKGYVLLSQNPILTESYPLDTWKRNHSLLENATQAVADIVRSSRNGRFQLGHLLIPMANEYGMLPLILGMLGALHSAMNIIVLNVSTLNIDDQDDFLPGVVIHCVRNNNFFWIRYVSLDLNSAPALLLVERAIRQDWQVSGTTTVIKGAEVGFKETLEGQLPNPLLDFILGLSSIIVEDVTGITLSKIIPWCGQENIHAFGAFKTTKEAIEGQFTKSHIEFAKLFDSVYKTENWHPMGHLGYGYCEMAGKGARANVKVRGAWHIFDDDNKAFVYCHLIIACAHGCK